MSLAVIFPGQGSQSAAMLPWLDDDPFARPVLDAMEALIGHDWRARSADPAWLSQNRIAQCLVTGIDLATWSALLGAGLPQPGVVAGYSVGEIPAFCAAGVFDVATALRLAQRRAELMDRSSVGGTLLSASGRTHAELAPAVERWGYEVAIEIAVDRFVFGGPDADIDHIDAALKALGAATVRLPIRVASHTSAMAQASAGFAAEIEPLDWKPPRPALIADYTGARVLRPAELKRCLAGQISHTVQWDKAMKSVAERLPSCVLELGPGAALARQWAAARPDIPARSADDFKSAASVVAWVCGLVD